MSEQSSANASLLVLRVSGTEPLTIELRQERGAAGGELLFGATQETGAAVTTSGGAENLARIEIRGNSQRPSKAPGDVALVASFNGVELARQRLTVLRLDLDEPRTTLFNDTVVTRTVKTTPPTPGLRLGFRSFRARREGGRNVRSSRRASGSSGTGTTEP